MAKAITLKHGGISLIFDLFDGKRLRLRTLTPAGVRPESKLPATSEIGELDVALQCTGEDRNDHHGTKLTGSNPGSRLVFKGMSEKKVPGGRLVTMNHFDPVLKLRVESEYRFFDKVPAVRRLVRVKNEGTAAVGIEYLSSALMHNFGKFGKESVTKKLRVHIARNSWYWEGQWKSFSLPEAGYADTALSAISADNIGNWSTSAYLPLGMLENTETGMTWFWQIEHNGSWHWELGSVAGEVYLYAGGPDEDHHQAWKSLKPGETYETVPASIGCVKGGFDEAVAALTQYRRAACMAPHADNRNCPVIFNDYMNCLWADPTTEKELPLIDAAAAAGCEYYVIDAGWYAERQENWWQTVGLWQPSQTRFAPEGLGSLLKLIRSKGMIPGLWLEIESAGVNSPLKDKPDSWFFMRHGKRVVDHGRYQLDFRNPEVRAHADEVIDRCVGGYGAGYIKMDYNISFQAGTEVDADSYGQGLLGHNRAYIAWMRDVYKRYPELVIESCASGGNRMDYAMLSVNQLQSSSDQTDYRKYPGILVGAMAGVLPEQLAVWAYPKSDASAREASFNMVNAMLCRIHQSGHLANLPAANLAQVKEGIRVYKKIVRKHIPSSVPFFPLGTPDITDLESPVAVGLKNSKAQFLAVWRLAGKSTVSVPLNGKKGWKLLYPTDMKITARVKGGKLEVKFPAPHMAALFAAQ